VSTLAEVLRNRFNGFHERAADTFQLNGFSEEEETVKTVLRLLNASV